MLFYRVRFLLAMTQTVPRLHPLPWPMVYALLCQAWAKGSGEWAHLPTGVMVHAPEQLRVSLASGEQYAFGIDMLAETQEAAADVVHKLRSGLIQIGRTGGQRKKAETLGGNFELLQTEDLFSEKSLHDGMAPEPLDANIVTAEVEQLSQHTGAITLDFQTPLRWRFPRAVRKRGQQYFDRQNFPLDTFLDRIKGRLESVGLDVSGVPPWTMDGASVVDNRLVWLDAAYRNALRKIQRRKGIKLSGASGELTIVLPPQFPRHWLVWSQYVHLGEATSFGLGRFRIRELGPDRFPCRRSRDLIGLSFNESQLQQSAIVSNASAVEVSRAGQLVKLGQYEPRVPKDLALETPTGIRALTIPHPIDMSLQRAVLETIGAGLDLLFEESSFAFRRGLGRHRAAEAIQKAFAAGYRWAAQADFESFFHSISHTELWARLRAYLGDEAMSCLIMQWVRSSPELAAHKRGLPMGAPLSPLLANLFLDRFDELIEQAGFRLVRFADDFLILTKEKDQAHRMFESARSVAAKLQLTLNREKARLIDLSADFTFLGFRFFRQREWQIDPKQSPIEIERLGWFDASTDKPHYSPRFLLPGETHQPTALTGSTLVIEPDADWVGVNNGHVTTSSAGKIHKCGPLMETISQILVLGTATIDESFWQALRKIPVSLVMANENGSATMEWFPTDVSQPADLVAAQVDISRDDPRRLAFAKQLIHAKLQNFAALAQTVPTQLAADNTSDRLLGYAQAVNDASTIDEVLGLEGAGAAKWYSTLTERLPSRFPFAKRISPKATDPINVMLNIAHTHIYRQCQLALRMMGLVPAIGILHKGRGNHAALASDLHEPFRMLAERAVIETAWRVEQSDFFEDPSGHFPLKLSAKARRRLLGTLYQSLAQSALSQNADEAFTFRNHLFRLARSVRAALSNGSTDIRVFCCPTD